jgi:hypothetical protein
MDEIPSPYQTRDLDVHWVPKGTVLPCVMCGIPVEVIESGFQSIYLDAYCQDCYDEIEWPEDRE